MLSAKMWSFKVLKLAITILLSTGFLSADSNQVKSQYFIESPRNMTVNEGDTILLKCQVGNLQGTVQWTRAGFAMGYSNQEVQRTCQRCELETIASKGIFNLRVKDVRLGEDEHFECQVSPGKGAINSVPLRTPVKITIQVPPNSVTLKEPKTTKAGEYLELACTATDSNPKTTILWYRGPSNNLIPILDAEMSEKVYQGSRNGTYMTVSKIKLRVTSSDDSSQIRCKAEHPAMIHGEIYHHLQASANLTVLYPPSAPEIEGDLDPYRRIGDKIRLACRSDGGNPLPEITWLKNGSPLQEDLKIPGALMPNRPRLRPHVQKLEVSRRTQSVLEFEAAAADHGSIFTCRAFARETMQYPMESSTKVTFNISFPPEEVKIVGEKTVRADHAVSYSCLANNANPAPTIEWTVNGKSWTSGVNTFTHPPPATSNRRLSGEDDSMPGWRVKSDLALDVIGDESRIYLTCQAHSRDHHGQSLTAKAELEVLVLKPPSPPEINGLPQNETLREGQSVNLVCSSMDGSPQPKLAWFKGDSDKELPNTNFSLNPFSQLSMNLKVTREDNDREYRCEATNQANTKEPSINRVQLRVFFPPESLAIEVERPEKNPGYDRTTDFAWITSSTSLSVRKKFRGDDSVRIVLAGELVRLRCQAGTSKPRPLFRWLEDHHVIREANRTQVEQGDFGGERLTSLIEFRAGPEHNEKIFSCFAHNPTIEPQIELNATITLVVLFKPRFNMNGTFLAGSSSSPSIDYDNDVDETHFIRVVVVEGETKNISVNAEGNPPQIQYSWSFPGMAETGSLDFRRRVQTTNADGVLTIFNARRTDAGLYNLTAWNGHGDFTSSLSVQIDVLFPPIITNLSENITLNETDTAEFRCSIDANPFDESTVEWDLPDRVVGFGFSKWTDRASFRVVNNTSIFTLDSIRRLDAGRIVCKAKNGVGNVVATKTTHLIINHAPYFEGPAFVKKAEQRGSPAFLRCRCQGVPSVSFTWHVQPAPESDNAGQKAKQIKISDRDKGMSMEATKKIRDINFEIFESVLILDSIRTEHYSMHFICKATNLFGTTAQTIQLVSPSQPDPPSEVEVIAFDDDSAHLMWRPGFDGGFNQTFDLQVYDALDLSRVLRVRGVKNVEDNQTVITGLKPKTKYAIRVRARNRAGSSNFTDDVYVRTRAMERAQTSEVESSLEIIIVAIVAGLVVVVIVSLVIYLGCFKIKRPGIGGLSHQQQQQQQQQQQPQSPHNEDPKGKQNKKQKKKGRTTCADFGSGGDAESDDFNPVIIERYTPTKYSHAINAEFYGGSPFGQQRHHHHHQTRRSSTSSQLDYKELVRSFSVPDPDDLFMNSNGSRFVHQSGGSCSMHNTLRRPQSSSGGLNTTLEDDVFFEDHLDAPNSAKPLLSETRQFYLQNFPHLSMSGNDPMDSSSSSRSRTIPNSRMIQQQQPQQQQQQQKSEVFRPEVSSFRFGSGTGDPVRNKRRVRSSSTASRLFYKHDDGDEEEDDDEDDSDNIVARFGTGKMARRFKDNFHPAAGSTTPSPLLPPPPPPPPHMMIVGPGDCTLPRPGTLAGLRRGQIATGSGRTTWQSNLPNGRMKNEQQGGTSSRPLFNGHIKSFQRERDRLMFGLQRPNGPPDEMSRFMATSSFQSVSADDSSPMSGVPTPPPPPTSVRLMASANYSSSRRDPQFESKPSLIV